MDTIIDDFHIIELETFEIDIAACHVTEDIRPRNIAVKPWIISIVFN